MRLLVDENVDAKIIPLLKKIGHDARRVPLGVKNGAVMRLAIQEKRILITRDADFTDAAKFPPSRACGIIHLNIHPPRFDKIAPALCSFLKSVSEPSLSGRLFVLDETGYAEFE